MSKRTFHTVGDSHSSSEYSVWTFDTPEKPYRLSTHHIGPRLMHSFNRDPIGVANLSAYNLQNGDWVCFCFGEIDCRCHVFKHVNDETPYPAVIDALVGGYMKGIEANRALFPDVKFAVFMIPPTQTPTPKLWNAAFPHLGTDAERTQFCVYANKQLAAACEANNFLFVEAFDSYTDGSGLLDPAKADEIGVHMKFSPPIEAIVDAIFA